MSSERTFINCNNFRHPTKCDSFVRKAFPIPQKTLDQAPPVEWKSADVEKAEQICQDCPNFGR